MAAPLSGSLGAKTDLLPFDEAAKRHVLAFGREEFGALRRRLLADAPLESACFLLARPVRTPGGSWRLVAYDAIEFKQDDYKYRTDIAAELRPECVAHAMQRARAEQASIVLAHSHPFAMSVSPSSRDRDGEKRLLTAFRRRVPAVPHARLIVSPSTVSACLFGVTEGEYDLEVVEVGPHFTLLRGDGVACAEAALQVDSRRYHRQVQAFGLEGQAKLQQLRIAIIGLGGTGSVVAQQLAYLGGRSFVLFDFDRLDETNLNRVVGARPEDVGRDKVDIAKDLIRAIQPAATVVTVRGNICDRTSARLLLDTDVFFLCTDSQGSRAVVSQMAYQYFVPGFDVGVAIHAAQDAVTHISGRVQMLAPGLPCLVCGNVLDPEEVRRDLLSDEARVADPYIVGARIAQPAVVSINSAASSLAVTMFLSAVTGMPYETRNQRLRLETGVVARVDTASAALCPICSPTGAFARGDSWQMPGRAR